MKRVWLLLAILVGVVGVSLCRPCVARIVSVVNHVGVEKKMVRERVAQYSPEADRRLSPVFCAARVAYPPKRLVLVALKQERELEVYAAGAEERFKFVKSYKIHAASGALGPKQREGDGQVPEGIYGIESLNPNSLFHLSLRINYPNKFDCAQATQDGRKNLGGDIMIHGGAASIGCLAMGDEAAEDLFILAAKTGIKNIVVILSPVDFRIRDLPPSTRSMPSWTASLYRSIKTELDAFPRPQ